MNILNRNMLILAALFAFAAVACKKEKDPTVNTTEEHPNSIKLKAHSWKYNSFFYQIKNGIPLAYNYPSCLSDDKLDYNADGKYIKDAGSDICQNQVQKDTMSWELINSGLQLKLSNKSYSVIKEIILFQPDSLVTLEVNANGDSIANLYLRY